jgi:FtsP/CotA-like multicopper oxidase with cupredoxin domain
MSETSDETASPAARRMFLRAGAAGSAHLIGAVTLAGAAPIGAATAATPRPAVDDEYVPRPKPANQLFTVRATTLNPDDRQPVPGVTVNGSFPGPEIRAPEGSILRVEVQNALADQPTTIHWHGLLVPSGMDGVPEVANYPIGPGGVYVYEFPLRQSGTYWYHSHWQLQEQVGLAGPLVIEARDEPLRVDHDAVVMLADWLHGSPYAALDKLKQGPPAMGGAAMPMAMDPGKPDLSDLAYDSFLLNGRGTQEPWTLQARRGERIRLRIINAGASTYFRLRLDGLPLTITHADGLAVHPVQVDHLLIGMAETYDALVTLPRSGSYTLHAVAMDGSGQAIGVLHTPDVKPSPNLALPAFNGRNLEYRDLRAQAPTTLPAGPVRAFDIALQGNMARYVWSLNGQTYPTAAPLPIRRGERVQLALRNETSMWHPMHLHGHFFRVLQGAGANSPLKHTVNVPPRETVHIEFSADNPGRWIFHCHNLYHLEAGMARVIEYEA